MRASDRHDRNQSSTRPIAWTRLAGILLAILFWGMLLISSPWWAIVALVCLGTVATAIACWTASADAEGSTPEDMSAIHWTMIPDDFDESDREEIEGMSYDGPVFPEEAAGENNDIGRPADPPEDTR